MSIEGESIPVCERRFLGLPTWIRAGREETGGALSLVEQVIPPGFESPWHMHRDEDESFYVIEGAIQVVVEDRSVTLGVGDYAFGPRGVAHGFRVVGDAPVRLLLMTTGGAFADFMREASDPADGGAQGAGEPDMARLMAAAERNGLAILGPMPS
ncbi:cupin domain-containing protein [Kaistia algarum]|nr:cupin domain-containing protein [Kaistia algarum]